MKMQRYKLLIAYDGFAYSGWQVQPGMKTIQGELERCFREFTGEKVIVHGSGRTDQGVHALGQVAHVDLPPVAVSPSRKAHVAKERAGQPECRQIMKALNALLPPDIRLLKAEKAGRAFHARRSAISKEYRYFIWNAPVMNPFMNRYRMHVRQPLDAAAMRQAAHLLTGRRDFAAFTANARRVVDSTVRAVTLLAVRRRGHEVVIVARGEGFLYRMVRSLAGLLIRVGLGDVPFEEAKTILEKKVRTAVVPTAPPQGLFLWKVYY